MCFQANLEGSLRGKTRKDAERQKWRSCAEVGGGVSKRQNIAELVGYEDFGGEMMRKVKFETVQGSAPTISVK